MAFLGTACLLEGRLRNRESFLPVRQSEEVLRTSRACGAASYGGTDLRTAKPGIQGRIQLAEVLHMPQTAWGEPAGFYVVEELLLDEG